MPKTKAGRKPLAVGSKDVFRETTPAAEVVGHEGVFVDVPERHAFAFLDDGYAVERVFTVHALRPDGEVVIDVEIEDKRARARRVSVSTDSIRGVSSTTLRSVPIRDIVATGITWVLHRIDSVADDSLKDGFNEPVYLSVQPDPQPADVEAVRRLVGYVEVKV